MCNGSRVNVPTTLKQVWPKTSATTHETDNGQDAELEPLRRLPGISSHDKHILPRTTLPWQCELNAREPNAPTRVEETPLGARAERPSMGPIAKAVIPPVDRPPLCLRSALISVRIQLAREDELARTLVHNGSQRLLERPSVARKKRLRRRRRNSKSTQQSPCVPMRCSRGASRDNVAAGIHGRTHCRDMCCTIHRVMALCKAVVLFLNLRPWSNRFPCGRCRCACEEQTRRTHDLLPAQMVPILQIPLPSSPCFAVLCCDLPGKVLSTFSSSCWPTRVLQIRRDFRDRCQNAFFPHKGHDA